MHPTWLESLAIVYLFSSVTAFVIVVADIIGQKNYQKMKVMNIVWPVTQLYFGPLGLYWYFTFGLKATKRRQQDENADTKKAFWQSVFVSVCHCGAGCSLGDLIGETIVHLVRFRVFGIILVGNYIADYFFAYVLGIYFQYMAIKPMHEDMSRRQALWSAIKADTLSLTAFEVGLFGWMALMYFVLFQPPLHGGEYLYWFMMQIGMVLGFLTSYPVNRWLVRKGIKEAM